MDLELSGQVVAVTGSSRGIGKGIAAAFLKEGARVILTGRDVAALQKVERDFQKSYGPDQIRSFPGDLQKAAVIEELYRTIQKNWSGVLDHLVLNIGTGRSVPPLQEDEAEWSRLLEINLLAASRGVRTLLPLLESRALQARATPSIIFISSICGVEALGCPVAYAAAKSALISYAKNIARPLGPRGIRVNLISAGNVFFPGSTWEDKLARNRTQVEEMLGHEVPLQRLGTIEEVADVAVFLASKRAAFIHGANLVVDGGQTRSL